MNSAYAYLAIIDPPAGVDAATERLRVAPTNIKKKGDPRVPGATIVEKNDVWILESPTGRHECDLALHVSELLRVLEPRKKEIAELVAECDGRLTLVSYSEHANRDCFFSKQQLALTVEMGLHIWCDFYFTACVEKPNKSPEPTPTAVTPRATESRSK